MAAVISGASSVRRITQEAYSRKCLAIRTERALKSDDVLETLSNLFITEGLYDFDLFRIFVIVDKILQF